MRSNRVIFSRALSFIARIIDLGSEVGVADGEVTRRGSGLWKVFSQAHRPNSLGPNGASDWSF